MSKNILATLLGIMAAACTLPEQELSSERIPPLERMSFNATVEPDTKTVLEGSEVKWDDNDKISVFDGYANRCFTIERILEDGSAVFSGEAVAGQSCYYACYPYGEHNSLGEAKGIQTSFVSRQTVSSAGSFGDGCNVSVAISDNGGFAFKNIGGLLRFTLSRGNVTSITLSANDGEPVCGNCEVHLDGSGNISSMQILADGEPVTLVPESGGSFAPGEYFFCVRARTYTGGIKLLLDTVEGEQIQAGTSADVVVERSLKTSLGTIDTSADKAHRTLVFTPIEDLNRTEELNSHAGLTAYSLLTPIGGTELSLDQTVLSGGPYYQYPRFVKTAGGDVLLFYHPSGDGVSQAGNRSNYLRSSNLIDWTFEANLFKPYSITDSKGESNTRAYAGAHAVRLPDGKILSVAATRALKNYMEREADNGLSIRISSDDGNSWGKEKLILLGTAWEPFPIVLPSGRIQIYYTDYNASTGGTGTSYIYSDDNGVNWTSASSGSHLRAFADIWYQNSGQAPVLTDQMPSVICLNGKDALAGVAESKTGSANSFSYKLSLAYSDADGNWGTPDSDGVLPSDRNSRFIPGAAPYFIQFPSGETVISYNVPGSGFCYVTGDENARNFSSQSCFFSNADACWGSMALLDGHRIIAGAGGNIGTLMLGQYYLNHAIFAKPGTVTLDSRTTDWTTGEQALWLCSGEASKATIRSAENERYLFLLAEVEDTSLSESDYMEITLTSLDYADGDGIRIRANYRGLVQQSRYSGAWQESSDPVVVKAAFDGTSAEGDTDHGYLLEIGIPLECLPNRSGRFMLGLSLSDSGNSDTCELAVPLICKSGGTVVGHAGNGNSGTGASWTYETGDYEW